jgi:hypothetical protein
MKVLLAVFAMSPFVQSIGQTLSTEHEVSFTTGKNAQDYNKYIKEQLVV